MATESLRKLGLTEYEAKAYLALLKHGAMKGREVAEKSGVPPTRVFDTLKALANKGFASLISSKPMVFKPVKAEIAIAGLLQEKRNELETIEKSTIESLKNFQLLKQIPGIEEKLIIVSGYEKMYNLANELTNRARREILIMSAGEKTPQSIKVSSKNAIERGTKIKFIATQYNAANIHYLKELKSVGYDIRYYPAKDYSIAIQDRESCIIIIKNPDDPKNRITIFFDSKDFSSVMTEWFKTIWKKAKIVKL